RARRAIRRCDGRRGLPGPHGAPARCHARWPHPDHLPHRDHRPGRRSGRTRDRTADHGRLPRRTEGVDGARGALTVATDPETSPGFLLWHITLRWQREIAAVLTPLDLTHVQFVLLASTWWLNTKGQDPNQLTLAQQAGTDVKMTSEVLR